VQLFKSFCLITLIGIAADFFWGFIPFLTHLAKDLKFWQNSMEKKILEKNSVE
jgi:hypothetical protein